MKEYRGTRTHGSVLVTVNGAPLNPRHDLYDHSPTGFEWGYPGSGPAQLALAILADHLADDEAALASHQEFKFAVIATLPEGAWTLSSQTIDEALRRIRTQLPDLGDPA